MPEWFEEWFGDDYLHLYPHRDDADAERAIALVRRAVPLRPGWRVLDLGCGAGRHLRALEAAGARPVGLDLSATLLRRARAVTRAPLLRADLRRLPIRPGSIDLAVNLFTSFGYFEGDDEHAAALAGVSATLRPGGWFVLDFLNADTVRAALGAGSPSPALEVTRRLSADGRSVLKRICLPGGRTVEERVRLFGPRDLARMFAAAGLRVEARHGDYDGSPLAPGSPRAILVGRVA
ncbi:MAG TPA: methyltransferase domain-containing protein [Gemmatimonadales bacterium]|nr:methyltransferase domain-containing protein [Gemmatimonadales bacterium]